MLDFYLVGKGKIRGLWCDAFWVVNKDGEIGDPKYSRKPTSEERAKILVDIERNIVKLKEELAEVEAAKRIMEAQ